MIQRNNELVIKKSRKLSILFETEKINFTIKILFYNVALFKFFFFEKGVI